MAVHSVFAIVYWQFLLQSRLSDSIEHYNKPPRLQGTSQNRIFWFKSTRWMLGAEVLYDLNNFLITAYSFAQTKLYIYWKTYMYPYMVRI